MSWTPTARPSASWTKEDLWPLNIAVVVDDEGNIVVDDTGAYVVVEVDPDTFWTEEARPTATYTKGAKPIAGYWTMNDLNVTMNDMDYTMNGGLS